MRGLTVGIALLTVSLLWFFGTPLHAQEAKIIVIDPGHGGTNIGAAYFDWKEKDINLAVAMAMREELMRYEGVEVYLTREDDHTVSILERAELAKEYQADLMISLHYNASTEHQFYGAEVWVPSDGDLYEEVYPLANLQLEHMQALGLYNRGIKTRLGEEGDDYYGILRYCSQYGIASLLFEHAHLDHAKDSIAYDDEEAFQEVGIADATAVAMYYGLRSDENDYSNFLWTPVTASSKVMVPDITVPSVAMIRPISYNMVTREATLQMEAADEESGILYYAYSLDGGDTYSSLYEWYGNGPLTISLTTSLLPEVLVSYYNGYDLSKESEQTIYYPRRIDTNQWDTAIIMDERSIASDILKGYSTLAAQESSDSGVLSLTHSELLRLLVMGVMLLLFANVLAGIGFLFRYHSRKNLT